MIEPLEHFFEKYGVDVSKIDRLVFGIRYTAVLLKNGNIGVCANLFNKVEVEIEDLKLPDLNNISHRIILNAYFNAALNYSNKYNDESDIFDIIHFSAYKKIVMIGYFGPLLERFKQDNIKISVFDLKKKNYQFTSEKSKMKYTSKAEAVILTATSIFNETFMSIVKNTRNNCDIFILGPSSIMNEDMLKYKNIKMIFGSVFQSSDERVLNTIRTGGGTKQFIRFGKKVYF
ncbi:MAG: hypothetical protein ISS16_06740 [Ignavibacteria bacterium]|nr:hypothetical protein [Ignavibacteria bacterium]